MGPRRRHNTDPSRRGQVTDRHRAPRDRYVPFWTTHDGYQWLAAQAAVETEGNVSQMIRILLAEARDARERRHPGRPS